MIRSVVVDDEPLARRRIIDLLASETDVDVIAECAGGAEAIDVIEEHRPDLLFLDIQMPEVDGFRVLQAVGAKHAPDVVFVTAHDEFAIQAFEFQAVDYLLKPFARDRFRSALERARTRIGRGRGDIESRLAALLERVERTQPLDRLPVTVGKKTRFVRLDDVESIHSEGNYLRLIAGEQSHLVRGTMKTFEERLDGEQFVRINRSVIVNVGRVAEIIACGDAEYVVVTSSGARLVSGAAYARRVRRLLENPF